MFQECWKPQASERPLFEEVLSILDELSKSSFVRTPHESFHSMQNDWRVEIETMFEELKSKEKVDKFLRLLFIQLEYKYILSCRDIDVFYLFQWFFVYFFKNKDFMDRIYSKTVELNLIIKHYYLWH